MNTNSYTPTAVLALGSHTQLAIELNAAMAADVIARLDYLFEYGTSWQPLPTPGYSTPELTVPTLGSQLDGIGLAFDGRNYLAL